MRVSLICHPDTPCEAVTAIEVEVERQAWTLALRYRLEGDLAAVVLPPHESAERTDELWRHTCFEAFLRTAGASGYHEFNVAPSGRWAAYRFDGYRDGMAEAEIYVYQASVDRSEGVYQLQVEIELNKPPAFPWEAAITAVIEEANGRKSYWALAHPPGKPDFHHPDGFILELK